MNLVNTQARASQFDYELVSRAASLAVVLNLSTTDYSAKPVVLSLDHDSTAVMTLPFVSTDNPSCCYLTFEWDVVSSTQAAVGSELQDLGSIDSCTLVFITIFKDFTIDLLSVLGNFKFFQLQGSKITSLFLKWWGSTFKYSHLQV